MQKIMGYLLICIGLFLNMSFVKAEVIDDLIKKLPNELNNCYEKIYNKDATKEKINYKVSLGDEMLYITEEKDGKTKFVDGLNLINNEISYETIYDINTNYEEIENRNKVNYLAIFNVMVQLSGYTPNFNNQIISVLESGNYVDNGYSLKREQNSENIKETFKINMNNFVVQEDLENENYKKSTQNQRIAGYIIATIIAIIGLGILVYLNRDFIFGGKFFK